MSKDWQYWRAELKAPGSQPRNEVEQRVAGYWRADGAKSKPSWPVAVWYDEDGTPHHKVGNSQKDGEDLFLQFMSEATWLRCVAVPHIDYLVAMETGLWPSDGKHARHMDEAERHGIDITPGDNAAPVEEALDDQIASLASKIDKTPEPASQEQANALSGLLDKMRTLLRLAEAERVKEKEPHKTAAENVDAKWRIIKTPGERAGIAGEARRKAFLKKEQARLNERIRAENEKRAAEALPPAEAARAAAGAAFGRVTGLKKVRVVDVVDFHVLGNHLIDGGDEDMQAYLMDRAKKATRAKVTLPGVTTKEELQ